MKKIKKIKIKINGKIKSINEDSNLSVVLKNLKIPILGIIPKNSTINLESRHLGLIPVTEQKKLHKIIQKISKEISDYLNFDLIEKICKKTSSLKTITSSKFKKPKLKYNIPTK